MFEGQTCSQHFKPLPATNELVDTRVDGRDGLNHEHVFLSYCTTGGASWIGPMSIEQPADRGYYTAPGISPNGTDLYVVYNAFLTPYRTDTTSPRSLDAVVLHADIGAGGTPTGWSVLHRSPPGDPRGSSANSLTSEFLGDYVYAIATRTYGAAVWNDVRNAADCPAIDAYRMSLQTGGSVPRPAPNVACPAAFGNSGHWRPWIQLALVHIHSVWLRLSDCHPFSDSFGHLPCQKQARALKCLESDLLAGDASRCALGRSFCLDP
jgi:hypothetical protein